MKTWWCFIWCFIGIAIHSPDPNGHHLLAFDCMRVWELYFPLFTAGHSYQQFFATYMHLLKRNVKEKDNLRFDKSIRSWFRIVLNWSHIFRGAFPVSRQASHSFIHGFSFSKINLAILPWCPPGCLQNQEQAWNTPEHPLSGLVLPNFYWTIRSGFLFL